MRARNIQLKSMEYLHWMETLLGLKKLCLNNSEAYQMTIPTDTTDVNQEKVEAYMKEKSMYMWRAYRGQVAEEF